MSQLPTPRDPHYEHRVRDSFDRQIVMNTIGATLDSVAPGKVEISFAFSDSLTQQHGFIHAGIVSTVLDSACGYAAFSLMPANAAVLTIEFKINLLAPAAGERFKAVAQVQKSGRTVSVATGDMFAITGEQQKHVASMTGTLMTIIDRDDVRG
ncbi:MAG: PaaI family thioesterase [Pseudomonadota bacterium]